MPQVLNTGERILPEKESPLMTARHLCAYEFAGRFVKGKAVLDIGCGEGYGSHYLAGSAKNVTGIDYSKEAIEHAKNKYPLDNLAFYSVNIKELDSIKDKFDIICSFQVIEHLEDPGGFLGNVKGLLSPGGVFICSTPNRLDASPNSDKPANRFHVKEYLFDEFMLLLGEYFDSVEPLGLKRGRRLNLNRRLKKIGLFNFLPDCINPVKRFYSGIGCGNFIYIKNNLDTALDFIVVCRGLI
ncbi:MAG: class I SAM-dependent methyltransferase [Candidatus Omnitrophota bacterium]|jgi:SAM-dependent methyltransferase